MNEASGRLTGCNVVNLAGDLGMNSATAAAFFTYVANMVEDYVVVNGASSLLKYNGLGVAADGSAMANLTRRSGRNRTRACPPATPGRSSRGRSGNSCTGGTTMSSSPSTRWLGKPS
eukprot:TRINITY_DN5173_c0_g1_i1.p2 TRINITY_DN5173_c0_g1~~TRINITY_DN5173_c0_g1_i1.p2  ORF type:complete len:117 (-),score=11.06 TRINITY_DN5173_c0_g1_i1:144-494(-)